MDKIQSPISLIRPEDTYFFDLLDFDNIDFANTTILKDGTISLALDVGKIPRPEFETSDEVFQELDEDDEYNLIFSPEHGIIETLSVVRMSITHNYECIYPIIMNVMEFVHYSEFQKYKQIYDQFNSQVMEWVKQQIRAIMTDVKGEFRNDTIDKDTYFQSRELNDHEIYYIICRWWDKVHKSEVNFVDVVNGEGTVYVARN